MIANVWPDYEVARQVWFPTFPVTVGVTIPRLNHYAVYDGWRYLFVGVLLMIAILKSSRINVVLACITLPFPLLHMVSGFVKLIYLSLD